MLFARSSRLKAARESSVNPLVLGSANDGYDVLMGNELNGIEIGFATGNRNENGMADELEGTRRHDARVARLHEVLELLELAPIGILG